MPEIVYNSSKNELQVRMQKDILENKNYTIYKDKDIPLQRWNHVVFNYDGGTFDMFLNNKLVTSRKKYCSKK